MRDYARGSWETLNYCIRFLEINEKDEALTEFRKHKEEIEQGVATDFNAKLRRLY